MLGGRKHRGMNCLEQSVVKVPWEGPPTLAGVMVEDGGLEEVTV